MADTNIDDMTHCFENLIVIDVGCNLTNKKYSRDLDSVIQRAKDSGNINYAFKLDSRSNKLNPSPHVAYLS